MGLKGLRDVTAGLGGGMPRVPKDPVVCPKTGITPRKTNIIAIENGAFEDVFPIENGDIPACYVSLPEGISTIL